MDYNESWSEDDIGEFTETSWGYVLRQVEEDEANADTG
jgi:hypothetical protein